MATLNELMQKAVDGTLDPSGPDLDDLRRAACDCPSSPIAPALLLKYASDRLDPAEAADYRSRVALMGGCQQQLIGFIDPSARDFAQFYPPEPDRQAPDTTSAIDTFLETYGHASTPEEDALLERLLFNPVPDYAEQLARETPAPAPAADRQDSLIDSFIEAHAPRPATPAPKPKRPQPAPAPSRRSEVREAPGTSLLSESLAKIFIKQGRYDRAYEIISNLSLNYPEKSIYFADQLRFLEKLIINQRFSKTE